MGSSELSPFRESLLRRVSIETLSTRVSSDLFVERIGPGPDAPDDSVLVPIAAGTHTAAAARAASEIGVVYNMRVQLVTALSETADTSTIKRTEQQRHPDVPDETDTIQTNIILGETTTGASVRLTRNHDITVLGVAEQSTLAQFLSGTIPMRLARRGKRRC